MSHVRVYSSDRDDAETPDKKEKNFFLGLLLL